MNDAALTAIQTTAFILVGGLSRRYLAREGAPVVRAILAAGLAAGGSMHVVQLIERGPLVFSDQPLAFNVFWTSLTVADPLGALLLNIRPRAGMLVTLAIMGADVSINLPAFAHSRPVFTRKLVRVGPDRLRAVCHDRRSPGLGCGQAAARVVSAVLNSST